MNPITEIPVDKALAELQKELSKSELRHRVLVIDDVRDNIDLMVAYLKRYPQLEVETCSDAQQALDRLLANGHALVFIDLMMPKLNGMEVIQRVMEKKPKTPFVIVTAYGDQQLRDKAMGLGAILFLEKPITPQDLDKVLGITGKI